jgi:hypothetical protein
MTGKIVPVEMPRVFLLVLCPLLPSALAQND